VLFSSCSNPPPLKPNNLCIVLASLPVTSVILCDAFADKAVCEINLGIVNERLIKNVDKLKPYGNGNEEPIFIARNLKIESSRVVGKNQNTIQFVFDQNGDKVKAVGFKNIKEKYEELEEPSYLDIAFTITLNEWPEGTYTPQLIIKDIRKV
jgi:hypothetical protein